MHHNVILTNIMHHNVILTNIIHHNVILTNIIHHNLYLTNIMLHNVISTNIMHHDVILTKLFIPIIGGAFFSIKLELNMNFLKINKNIIWFNLNFNAIKYAVKKSS